MPNQRMAIYHRSCPFIEKDPMQELRDYAKAQGAEIIEYVEAKGKAQPALNNLLRDSKNGEFSAVLVHSLLTVGNSLKAVLSVMEKFRVLGINFICLSDGLDSNSTAVSLIAALTHYQKELTGQRIKLGLELARMRNTVIGRRPLEKEKVQSILDAHKGDRSVRDVAKLTHIPKSTCFRVIKNFEKNREESAAMSVQVT